MKPLLPGLLFLPFVVSCGSLAPKKKDELAEQRQRSILGLRDYDKDQRSPYEGHSFSGDSSRYSRERFKAEGFNTGEASRFSGREAETGAYRQAGDESFFSKLMNRDARKQMQVPDAPWTRAESPWQQSASTQEGQVARQSGQRYATTPVSEYRQAQSDAGRPTIVQSQALEKPLTSEEVQRLLGKPKRR